MSFKKTGFPRADVCRWIAAVTAFTVVSVLPSLAHHEPVHEQIAKAAVDSSDGLVRFANEVLGGQDTLLDYDPFEFDAAKLSPKDWVGKGSYNQDYWPRWGNHFYTVKPSRVVGKAEGLSDAASRFFILRTTNSYAWATVEHQNTPLLWLDHLIGTHRPYPAPENEDNWSKARVYQLAGLTSSSKTIREENLAHMFYSLGHIIHLNQDLSQPDHTRDDAHPVKSHAFIENFGDAHRNHPEWFNPQRHGWAYWRDQAHFTKLLDFWDRDRFKGGSAAALIAEASGNAEHKLGLAEFSNGNFLGEDALYAENIRDTNETHYFPFPKLADTDQPKLKAGGWWSYMDSSILADGTQAPRPFLKKLGSGVQVQHHSVLKYLGAMNMGKMGSLPGASAISIDAPEVLKDYHDILVPKAVEYSAGILDYFFRGQIDYGIVSYSPTEWVVTVKNVSGESFKGGAFTLLADDTGGNRTTIMTVPLASNEVLADGETREMHLNTAPIATSKYMLVYQGTIGLKTDGTPNDPVDEGKAIAVKQMGCTPEAQPPVPYPLEIPDNTDLGTVTIVNPTTTVSFGTIGAGRYHIEYVEGALKMYNPNSQETFYVTSFCRPTPWIPGNPCADHIYILPVWMAGGGGASSTMNGFSGDLNTVTANTLAMNPLAIFSTSINRELGLAIDDTWSYASDLEFQPLGATYRLRRVAIPTTQPARLRIKDWQTSVKDKFNPCDSCPSSNGTEWDGTLPLEDTSYSSWDAPAWMSSATTLHGRSVNYYSLAYDTDSWLLWIECADRTPIWVGRKYGGADLLPID